MVSSFAGREQLNAGLVGLPHVIVHYFPRLHDRAVEARQVAEPVIDRSVG
jgi:hypothetical protein